ncbi:MAG TPA: hypothetical protein ENI69_10805, partial [Rhodospirillales bacterium]|nr:hypothetical protein [Rhodospirillales bacterium]
TLMLTVSTLVLAVSLAISFDPADAQETLYFNYNLPSVTVDLSVIEDSGYGNSAAVVRANRSKLRVPGAQLPISRLHVPPVGGAAAATARMAPVKRAAPATVPKKKIVAKVTPVPVPAVAPAPAPAPVARKKVASAAAPAPKKLAAPVQAVSAPPPPTVAAAPKVTPSETKMPEPVIVSKAKKQNPEQAAVPAPGADKDLGLGLVLKVVFTNDATRLAADAKTKLKALADKIKSRNNLRLQLMAYAGGDKLSSSLARRLSLSRALSVRSFLIENGIRSTRIDVRALGNKTDEKPLNRVDLNITER